MVVSSKNIIVKIIVSVLLINMVYITYKIVSKPRKIELDEVKLKDEIKIDKSKTLAVMLQNDTGEYVKSESSTFPTTGYRFNSTKSGCVDANGNIIENSLTYNNESNKVNLKANRKVSCYVYFDKLYTVTYELDGGIFDVTPPVKEVAYGDTYGELPIPTKEGYDFKGWNGKNKFNKSKYLRIENFNNSNDRHYCYTVIPLEKNTNYKVSVIRYNGFDGKNNGILLLNKDSNINTYYSSIAHTSFPNYTVTDYKYTTDESGLLFIGYYVFSFTQEYLNNIWNNTDVQIEEGTEATPYEPYFVTSNVIVTQQKDHILKAIWEENS